MKREAMSSFRPVRHFRAVEAPLVLACASFAPLFTARLFGVNFTAFDASIICLWMYYLVIHCAVPRLRWYYFWVSVFVLTALMSAVFAQRMDLAFQHAVQWIFIFFVVVPCAWMAARRGGNLGFIVAGFCLAGAFLVAHAVFEFSTGVDTYRGGRYDGFLGGANPTAFSVTALAPFVLIAPALVAGRLPRLGVGVVALAILLGLCWLLTLSASVTGIAALGFGAFFVVFLRPMSRGRIPEVVRKFGSILVGTVILVFVGVTALLIIDLPILELVLARVQTKVQSGDSIRLMLVLEALSMLQVEHVFYGVGFENYIFQSGATLGFRPHNIVMLLLIEVGVIGTVAFFGVLTILARSFFRYRRRFEDYGWQHRYATAAALASFAVFLLIASFNTQSVHRLYWFAFGVALALTSAEPVDALSDAEGGATRRRTGRHS